MNYKAKMVTALLICLVLTKINGDTVLDTITKNSYNHFTLSEEIKSTQNNDGSIFCVGSIIQDLDSTNITSPYIGNFSPNGDLLWEKNFNSFKSYKAIDSKISESNEILILLNKIDKSEFKLLKLNPLKDSLWCKTFNWNKNDEGLEILKFDTYGISILGSTRSFGNYTDFFKLEISQAGDSISNSIYKRIGSLNQYNFQDTTILQIGDIARSFSKHGIPLSQKNIIFSLTNIIDTNISYIEYGKTVSDYWPNHEYGFNIYPKSDSSFILLGCSGGYSSPRGLPIILEMDSNGDTIHTYCKGISSSSNTEYYSQAFKISDGWIFGAVAKSTNSITANNSKLVIEKRDNNLKSLWTQEFNYTGKDYQYRVIETGTDSLLLYGYGLNSNNATSFISIVNDQMVYNSAFNIQKQCTPINFNYKSSNKTINFKNTNNFSTIAIYNLKGQIAMVKSLDNFKTTNIINCKHLSSGNYIAIIKSKETTLKRRLIIN